MIRRSWFALVVVAGLGALPLGCGGGGGDEGLTTTESGLKYKDLTEGEGATAKKGDAVEVHYTGKLASNGKQFDSSVGKKPFAFTLGAGNVIKGWDEGVAGMKVGGKRKLVVPAKLAYGGRAKGTDIPPNSDLVFEVELLRIVAVKSEDLKVGTGDVAEKGDLVEVHYTGKLASNGKQFDSSVGKKPFAFTLGAGEVIKGWDAGVAGMKVGGKRKLVIPAPLGYGPNGSPPEIPPDADLVFEVELLKIVK